MTNSSKTITVFLSGRVSGLTRDEAVKAFEAGKNAVLERIHDIKIMFNGKLVGLINVEVNFINPMELVPEYATDSEAMALLLPKLCASDIVAFLPNWGMSGGSHVEEELTRYLHKNRIHL